MISNLIYLRNDVLFTVIVIIALCVTENNHYILHRFLIKLFLRCLLPDFLKTLPHRVGSSAIENVPSAFS